MISHERLLKMFEYDETTGQFIRLSNSGPRGKRGDVAGSRSTGYWRIEIDGRGYLAHRLAWFYKNGEWPENEIDHINMDRSDNRWCNLRHTTRSQNFANRKRHAHNKVGLKGVSVKTGTNKWMAQIRKNGRTQYLGQFDCPAAASFAYQIAADKLFGAHARAF